MSQIEEIVAGLSEEAKDAIVNHCGSAKAFDELRNKGLAGRHIQLRSMPHYDTPLGQQVRSHIMETERCHSE